MNITQVDCHESTVRIIRYIVISISLASALLTVVVIVLEKLYLKILKNLVLLIQLCYCVLCLAVLSFDKEESNGMCHAQAYFYYSAWFVANSLTLVLQYAIIRILREQIMHLTRDINIGRWLSLTLGLLVFCIPLLTKSYHKCGAGVGNCKFYCGLCSENQDPNNQSRYLLILWLNWIVPATLQVLFGIFMAILTRKIISNFNPVNWTAEKMLTRKVAFIPLASFILLFLNLITKILTNSIEIEGVFYLFVFLNLLFYLVPMFNLAFFIIFMRQYGTRLMYFEWLLCRGRSDKLMKSQAMSQRFLSDINESDD